MRGNKSEYGFCNVFLPQGYGGVLVVGHPAKQTLEQAPKTAGASPHRTYCPRILSKSGLKSATFSGRPHFVCSADTGDLSIDHDVTAVTSAGGSSRRQNHHENSKRHELHPAESGSYLRAAPEFHQHHISATIMSYVLLLLHRLFQDMTIVVQRGLGINYVLQVVITIPA